MPCISCLAIPIAFIGIGMNLCDQLIIGYMLTILSLCIYLHYKEFKKCNQCL